MKILTHTFILLIIASSAILPRTMVVCETDSGISIEFKQGKSCSCISAAMDLLEQLCCSDQEGHEDELITTDCHNQNVIKAGDCQDTKIELFDIISPLEKSAKAPSKNVVISTYTYTDFQNQSIIGLCKPVDVGKLRHSPSATIPQSILFKSTIVLLV